jgi:hypothetical protein
MGKVFSTDLSNQLSVIAIAREKGIPNRLQISVYSFPKTCFLFFSFVIRAMPVMEEMT